MESAEAVTDAGDAVLIGLSALVDHSLVRQVEQPDGTSRFMMLETIHDYGLEQLAAAGEADATYQRLLRYLCERFEAIRADWYNHNAARWLEQCDLERDNVRAALGWGVEHDPETALRLHSDGRAILVAARLPDGSPPLVRVGAGLGGGHL